MKLRILIAAALAALAAQAHAAGNLVDVTVFDRTRNVHLPVHWHEGRAYVAGFQWALERDYAFVFEMDADFSHNPEDLARLTTSRRHPLSSISNISLGCSATAWPITPCWLPLATARWLAAP